MNCIPHQPQAKQLNQPVKTLVKGPPGNINKQEVEQSSFAPEHVIYLTRDALMGSSAAQYELSILYTVGHGVVKNEALSLSWLREAATHSEHPHAEAQYLLGIMYVVGRGVKANLHEAFRLFLKSAENGHTKAKSKVGDMYYNGQGVEQDIDQAFRWYQDAAKQGDAWAQYMVGEMHYSGALGRRDYPKAIASFKRAACQEVKEANYKLGMIYSSNERGANQDNGSAFRYFRAAAKNGSVKAQYMLGIIYMGVVGISTDLEKAFTWFKKAADKGHAKAQLFLATFYFEALGPVSKKDLNKGIELISKSADQDNLDALLALGKINRGRFGYPQNPEQAFKCFEKAAKIKVAEAEFEKCFEKTEKIRIAEAEFELGICYEFGYGTDKDTDKALECYNASATRCFAPALTMLGAHYTWGTIVKQNHPQAYICFMGAAEQDDPQAQLALGLLCFNGADGVPINFADALFWLTKASEHGIPEATRKLAQMYGVGQGVKANIKKALELERLEKIQASQSCETPQLH